MVHLRLKDSKPKKPVADFKKKKRKVGKEVKRSNVTNISVKSKKINMPLQNDLTSKENLSEREDLLHLLKSCHHYSAPIRISSLDQLKQFITSCQSTEAYVTLIVPSLMELLYDEDSDVRKALFPVIVFTFKSFRSGAFGAVAPVSVTYICSGLTSIHKGIRRNSLLVLQAFCEYHPTILRPFVEKLLTHVIAILVDACQSSSQVSYLSSYGKPSEGGGKVAKSRDSDRSGGNHQSSNNRGNNTGESQQKSSLLGIVLQVLSSLLTRLAKASPESSSHEGISANHRGCWRSTFLNSQGQQQFFDNDVLRLDSQSLLKSDTNAVIMLRTRSVSNNYFERKYGITKQGSHTHSSTPLPISILDSLCPLLEKIWKGLTLESSILTMEVLPPMKDIANISFKLGVIFKSHAESPVFISLVNSLLASFPHSSREASIALPDSIEEIQSIKAVTYLDISLCDIVLMHKPLMIAGPVSGILDHEEEEEENLDINILASKYLLAKMLKFSTSLESELIEAFGTTTDSDEEDQSLELEDQQDMEVDGVVIQSKSRIRPGNNQKKQPFLDHDEDDMNTKLFRALTLMALAILDNSQKNDVGGILTNLHSLFSMLHELVCKAASVEMGIDRSTSRSLPLPQKVKVVVNCVCTIAQDDKLWSYAFDPSLAESVVETIAMLPKLLRMFDKVTDGIHMQVIQTVIFVLQHISLDACQDGSGLGAAAQGLSNSIQLWFTPIDDGKKMKSCPFLSSQAALRFALLEVYGNGSFLNIHEISSKIARCIGESRDSSEHRYFLQLLYGRRHLMNVSQFVSLLFLTIQGNLQSVALEIRATIHGLDSKKSRTGGGESLLFDEEHESLILRSLPSAQGSVTREVAGILTLCSSSDNPMKIIQFLISFLESFQAPLPMDESSDAKNLSYSEQFLKLSIAISSATIIEKLLAPFIARANEFEPAQVFRSDKDAEVLELPGLNELTIARKLFLKSLLWISRHVPDLSIFKYVNKGIVHDTLLRPFIVLMTSSLNSGFVVKESNSYSFDGQDSQLSLIASSDLKGEYPLFALFVNEFKASWKATLSHETKANMLYFLNLILEHALVIYIKSKYRDTILHFLLEILEPYLMQEISSEVSMNGEWIEKCVFIKDLGRSMMTA